MTPLTGKVALITGASRGIGRAIAERLGQDGATVIANYNQGKQGADEVIAQIQTHGGQAVAIHGDMSKVADIRQLFQQTVDRFGHIDILVNNSGISGKREVIADVTEENFDTIFAINVKGVLFALQEAARRMADGGRIINVSSSTTVFPTPGLAIYTASKAAWCLDLPFLGCLNGHLQILKNKLLPFHPSIAWDNRMILLMW